MVLENAWRSNVLGKHGPRACSLPLFSVNPFALLCASADKNCNYFCMKGPGTKHTGREAGAKCGSLQVREMWTETPHGGKKKASHQSLRMTRAFLEGPPLTHVSR